MKKIVFLLVATVLIGNTLWAQETKREQRKAREKEKIEEISELFEGKKLTFVAQFANPMGGKIIHLTSEYTLEIDDSFISAYLPFYGRAYRADLSGDGGIKFKEQAQKIEWDKEKKNYLVSMDVRAQNDVYQLRLTISKTGSATLNVSSVNKASISFNGFVVKSID